MKRLLIVVLALISANLSWAQTAASKIADGRAALVAHDLPTAHTRFQEALTLDPANQTAAALLGLTRLFDITSLASSQSFLNGLNVAATSRDVYNWTAKMPHDVNGNVIMPAAYNFTTFEAYWQATLLPESVAARANFATVTDPNFLITLSPAETKLPMSLNVDAADMLMAQVCLRAAEFFAHWGSGQNLDANLDAVMQALQGDMLTVQKLINDNPNFLLTGSASERTAAKTALLDMIALYRQASAAIRARPAGLHRLFMLAPEDLPMEAELRQKLDQVEQSLVAPIALSEHSLFAKPLFDATWSARAQLPTFSATGFNVLSVPDASLGGILAGYTKEQIAAALSSPHDTVADLGWDWVTPKPTGNTLYKHLALPGGRHLITGNGGTHLTSNDGTNWTYNHIPGLGQLVDVASDGAGTPKLVGISADGFIYVSTDYGVSWRRVSSQGGAQLNSITYGAGKYVVASNTGSILTSTDGESWTDTPYSGLTHIRIVYTGSLFVVASIDNTTQNSMIFTSPDAVNWTQRYNVLQSNNAFFGLAHDGAGTVLAIFNDATQIRSTDGGVTWTPGSGAPGAGPGVGSTITYSQGQFVAAGSTVTQQETATAVGTIGTGGTVAVTITGAGIPGSPLTVNVNVSAGNVANTWAQSVRGALSSNLAVTSLYLVSGSNASIILTRTNPAANDPTLNIALANGTSTGVTAAPTSADTRAGSLNNLATSSDGGVTWVPQASGEAVLHSGVSAGSGETYVMGQGGVVVRSVGNNTLFTRILPTQTVTPLQLNRPLLAIKAMDSQLYVGGGNNTSGGAVLIRSSDGQTFSPVTLPVSTTANNITDFLRVSATEYYACGNLGTLLKSADGGANWTAVTSGTTANLLSLAYLNSQYFALGTGSNIRLSANGTTWAASNNPVGGMQLNGIAYGNGVYVVVGGNNNPAAPASYLITSATAASGTWTVQAVPTNQTLKGIVFYQGVFTAVGTNGTIIRSTDGVTWFNAGSGDISSNISSISVLDGRYYATEANGNFDSTVFESQAAVLISSTGEDWVRVPLGTVNAPNRIDLFGGRLYTAHQNAGILRSQTITALAAPVVQLLATPAAGTPQGQDLTLAVTVTSDGAVTYQWKKDNVVIPGATESGLILYNVQPADAGSYTVDVTNAAGTTTSAPLVVTVSGTAVAPVITSQPESQTVNVGLSVGFSVEANGSTPFSYQWKKDGVNLTDGGNVSGALTPFLSITALTAANGGTYSVVVTNSVSSTTSTNAVLTVDSNPAYLYTTLAGSPGLFATTDGTGAAARFDNPFGVAVDTSGNVYVASPQSHTIRKTTSAGVVTTIAGSAYVSGSTEAPAGPATVARFNGPRAVALNAAGTELYIADTNNGKIRKIVLSTGVVSTFVSLTSPVAVAVDSAGNVYTAGQDNTVRKYTSGAVLTFTAGAGGQTGAINGTTGTARFNSPQGIALDAAGANLYVADGNNGLIRKVATSNFAVTTYAGRLGSYGADDGMASNATFEFPLGVAVDSTGNVFVTDNFSDVIRKISPTQVVSTIGGQANNRGFNNGADGDTNFSGPAGIAVDSSNNLYIAEQYNQIIRKGSPVTALNAPVVELQPQGQTVNVGSNVTLSVTATGVSTLSYQWRKDGVNLSNGGNVSGATTATLSLANVQTGDSGSYTVLVTATEGTALSAQAILNVSVAPVITVQPVAQNVSVGQAINLSVTVTGTGDITYQWRRNGVEIAGATGSTFTIPTAQRDDASVYDVVINGVGGSVISAPTLVSVAPTSYPGNLAIDPSFSTSPLITISCRIFTAIALPGGKWMVGGEFVRWDNTSRTFLARLNSDYSLDLTFTPPSINGFVYALALSPAVDGSIYVGGEFTAVDGHVVPGLFRLNSSGALDLSFVAQDSPPNASVTALGVQPDGKPLVARAATISYQTATTGTNVLRRLNLDGTLDATFSVNIVTNNNRLNAVIAEPTGGKIVFGGAFASVNASSRNGVARVDSTGATLDTAFGGTAGANNTVLSMTRLANGDYLVGGNFGQVASTNRNRAAIINGTTGALDTTFVPLSFNGNVLGAAQQTDGKIVLVGTFSTYNALATDGVVRVTATGAVDTLYPTGASSSSFSTFTASRSSYVFPQGDGSTAIFGSFNAALNQQRIGLAVITAGGTLASSPAPLLYRPAFSGSAYVVGNQTVVFGSIDAAGAGVSGSLHHAVRLNDDGTLDGSFPQGTGYTLSNLSIFGVFRATRQSDGKFLAEGDLAGYNGNFAYRMARINADGSFDSSFESGGGPSNFITPMLALSGGRTLLYGFAAGFTYNGQAVSTVLRLNADGSRDGSFNVGFGINAGTVSAAYEQPDGKLVLSGSFSSYNGTTVNGLMRLNTDGSLDSSFSAGTGITASTLINAIAGLPDGRLVLAGSFTTYNGSAANRMAIVSATGVLDGSFTAPVELNAQVGQVVLQEDGKIIATGDFTGTPAPYAVRLTSSGTIDSTFALRGITYGFGASSRIALADDGSVYVYAAPISYNYGTPLAVARFRGAPVAPTVATQPAPVNSSYGGAATFYAKANGTAPFTYQWRKNGTPISDASSHISGANYSVLNFTNLVGSDAGNYDVVITSASGSVTTATAALAIGSVPQTITFNDPPDIPFSTTPITLTATSDSGLTVSFAVLSGPATVSGNTLTITNSGTITIRASQAGNSTYAAATNVDQSFDVTATGFSTWRQTYFTGPELLDFNKSGPNAIYGKDGLPNLLKYALGLNPTVDATANLPATGVVATDWVYTYTRPASITDITYTVEVSTNLTTWTTAGVTHEFVSTAAGTDTWHAKYPLASAANVFFRLKVTGP